MANVKFTGLPAATPPLVSTDLIAVTQAVSSTPVSRSVPVSGIIDNTAYTSAWSGITTVAPSKNTIYTQLHKIDTADDGSIINAGTGFRIAAAAASGKILIGNGTNFVASTPTYPNASATTGKILISDGTNFVASTAIYPSTVPTGNTVLMSNGVTGFAASAVTYPNAASPTARKIIVSDGTNWVASTETYAAPGTAGNIMVSDGTNWTSKVSILSNASTAVQTGFAADQYLVGSVITVPAGSITAGSTYYLIFDMAKTAAGVANILINVRIGTAGTTADTAVLAYNSGLAQTAATDQGRFEILMNIRTIGTSATVIVVLNIMRLTATATGFFATALQCLAGVGQVTTTFNATTATKIGVSFNGGTSFSGTCQLVQAEYRQF